jgi:threonyl-tRNA synthetase
VKDEIKSQLEFVFETLRGYGLDNFYLELSTRDPEKSVGTDQQWEEATDTLRQVGNESGLTLVDDPGGAAFYGPKISVQATDAIGRTWQLSTVQLDFNQPERFNLQYTAADGTKQQPVMIHRALLGSIERFFAILLEHYAGAFPVWLSPVQVVGIPVAEAHEEYLDGVIKQLKAAGVRAELDASSERMQKNIRNAAKDKIPFQLIAGQEDMENGSVSFRFRDGHQENGIPVADAIARIREAIDTKAQV